ncbi:hypothetical protein HOF65_08165 [bacterium]|nr:hypothetical protein [bacterium]MBT3853864.1 hypothetical protein [bacterium]MBT4633051.1 hypothetical protein [bacterium]MBT5492324.1 hypothetical protein [bacterium]MBT6778370.1 hypothetical protein [bacterium]
MEISTFFYFAILSAVRYSLINVVINGAGFLNKEDPKLTIVQTSIKPELCCLT